MQSKEVWVYHFYKTNPLEDNYDVFDMTVEKATLYQFGAGWSNEFRFCIIEFDDGDALKDTISSIEWNISSIDNDRITPDYYIWSCEKDVLKAISIIRKELSYHKKELEEDTEWVNARLEELNILQWREKGVRIG